MIKYTALCALLLAGATFLPAQAASHEVDLSWTASTDPSTTVTVYRASGACSGSNLTFTKLTTSAPAGGPYKDTSVTAGTWCYYVTATANGSESSPSNNAAAVVPTAPPTGLVTVVVK